MEKMKTILVIIALSLSIGSANAQHLKDFDVPFSVKQGFERKYPGVKGEKWEKEGVDYKAKFELNKVESSAVLQMALLRNSSRRSKSQSSQSPFLSIALENSKTIRLTGQQKLLMRPESFNMKPK